MESPPANTVKHFKCRIRKHKYRLGILYCILLSDKIIVMA